MAVRTRKTKATNRKFTTHRIDDPSLEEIARITAEIREGWDPLIYAQRDCYKVRSPNIKHSLHVDVSAHQDN
mgnify:CR=1 FL=1